MSVNPNVDRLSIDERLRKLEARFPGGGGGGGNFSGTLPDFDQYPESSIKITSEGMIAKYHTDDFGADSRFTTLNGLSLKLCLFCPFQAGVLSSETFFVARVYYKYALNGVQRGQSSGGSYKPFDLADWVDYMSYSRALGGGPASNQMVNVQGGFSGVSSDPSRAISGSGCRFSSGINIRINGNNTADIFKDSAYLSWSGSATVDDRSAKIKGNSYAFACGWTGNVSSYAGAINVTYTVDICSVRAGQSIAIEDLNQFPDRLKKFYPQSWLVP